MWNIILLTGIILTAALIYRFRAPILARLARFDARNAQRRAEELLERRDRFAHYRRAVLLAEESLEDVKTVSVPDPRTGQGLKRYLFLGEHYETLNEAETARRARAIEIAREFYAELDGSSLPRRAPTEPAPAPPAALTGPDDKIRPPRPS